MQSIRHNGRMISSVRIDVCGHVLLDHLGAPGIVVCAGCAWVVFFRHLCVRPVTLRPLRLETQISMVFVAQRRFAVPVTLRRVAALLFRRFCAVFRNRIVAGIRVICCALAFLVAGFARCIVPLIEVLARYTETQSLWHELLRQFGRRQWRLPDFRRQGINANSSQLHSNNRKWRSHKSHDLADLIVVRIKSFSDVIFRFLGMWKPEVMAFWRNSLPVMVRPEIVLSFFPHLEILRKNALREHVHTIRGLNLFVAHSAPSDSLHCTGGNDVVVGVEVQRHAAIGGRLRAVAIFFPI